MLPLDKEFTRNKLILLSSAYIQYCAIHLGYKSKICGFFKAKIATKNRQNHHALLGQV